MGGPEMAPHTPQRSGRPGEAVAPLGQTGSYAIQTDLMLTNSRMPYSESSRP